MAINDPYSGVVFDPESNSVLLSHGQSEYPLYHCPFCGGAFPDSSQPVWVPIVPKEEFERVEQLIADLTDAEAIISRLGPPDYDATTHSHTSCNGTLVRDDTSPPVRNIEYYGYSDGLAIEFYITGGRAATHRLGIKNLSPRHRVSAKPGAPPSDGPTASGADSGTIGGPPSVKTRED
jgi:hypothetical protein